MGASRAANRNMGTLAQKLSQVPGGGLVTVGGSQNPSIRIQLPGLHFSKIMRLVSVTVSRARLLSVDLPAPLEAPFTTDELCKLRTCAP
jgi:hypothetical protein